MDYSFWKRKIFLSMIAGVLWGFFAMAANLVSGAFEFESTLTHNLITFTVGGIIWSIVTGGILAVAGGWIPLKGTFAKAVAVSTSFWLVLRLGGVMLSGMNPDRYHIVTPQTIQGLILAMVLGAILGVLWDAGAGQRASA